MSKQDSTDQIHEAVREMEEEIDDYGEELMKWVGDYDEDPDTWDDEQIKISLNLIAKAVKEIKKSKNYFVDNSERWGRND
jgi:uncharacterized protein Yka (UPF0111/DUF47 family)